jgi:spore cortex formation protein SpoVR/YcgB (stage V sporulation)
MNRMNEITCYQNKENIKRFKSLSKNEQIELMNEKAKEFLYSSDVVILSEKLIRVKEYYTQKKKDEEELITQLRIDTRKINIRNKLIKEFKENKQIALTEREIARKMRLSVKIRLLRDYKSQNKVILREGEIITLSLDGANCLIKENMGILQE